MSDKLESVVGIWIAAEALSIIKDVVGVGLERSTCTALSTQAVSTILVIVAIFGVASFATAGAMVTGALVLLMLDSS